MKWTKQRVATLQAALEAAQCHTNVTATWLRIYERRFFAFLGESRWEMHGGINVPANMARAKAVIVALRPETAPGMLEQALAACNQWMREQLSMGLQPALQRLVASYPTVAEILIDAMVADLEQSWDRIECMDDRVDWMEAGADLQPRGWRSI